MPLLCRKVCTAHESSARVVRLVRGIGIRLPERLAEHGERGAEGHRVGPGEDASRECLAHVIRSTGSTTSA